MSAPSHAECASELLDLVPLIMRRIRSQVRSGGTADLSIAQFRTLAFISISQEPSLSDVADHIGLSLPSMSKMIDQLFSRGLVVRTTHPSDRRRIILDVTQAGKKLLEAARQTTETLLARTLGPLSTQDRKTVCDALHLLRPLFDGPIAAR